MRVLITGGSGFIGRNLTATLLVAGHQVVAATRRVTEMRRRFPGIEAVYSDFNVDTIAEAWRSRLVNVDAVVNCAGILQQRRGQSIEAIHVLAPRALFDACSAAGVRRVVQISAVSADVAAGTAYANTKKQAEEYLAGLDLDWVILRPSLVYGDGSFGGTSLLRGLAALPFVLPVIGRGEQPFQPIHMDDLAATVLWALTDPRAVRTTLSPVGPETLTLLQIVRRLRAWLGFPPVPVLSVPLLLVRLAARFGDLTGGGPVNSTALRQMQYGNVAEPEVFTAATDLTPRSMEAALSAYLSHAQDRWHARLYFLRPLLRWSLALVWLISGIAGLLGLRGSAIEAVGSMGFSAAVTPWIAGAASVLDIGLGLYLLARVRPALLAGVQVAVIGAYTLALTLTQPGLWLDLFGPLVKNLPILVAILVLAALEDDR